MAGTAISRQQVINIARGVIKANNPSLLKEFGGDLELTENWARTVFKSLAWIKRKGTTGKLEPPAQLLAEEKFTFQRSITTIIAEHDIPPELVFNIDQTPLSYLSPGKYTFDLRGQNTDYSHILCERCRHFLPNAVNLRRQNNSMSTKGYISKWLQCNLL